jgi:hypothetical protein
MRFWLEQAGAELKDLAMNRRVVTVALALGL